MLRSLRSLAITACLFFASPQHASAAADCAALAGQEQQTACFDALLNQRKTLDVCDLAIDRLVKYDCYRRFARRSHSPGACMLIPADYGDMQASCLKSVARAVRDPNLCKDIRNPGIKRQCYFMLGYEKEACGDLETPLKRKACVLSGGVGVE